MAVSRADGADFDALPAGENLTGKLMFAAKLNTDSEAVLAGSGEMVYGIIVEENVENEPVTLQMKGLAKCVAGAAVNAGVNVMAGAGGKVVTATGAGVAVLGVCRKGCANANEIIEVELDRGRLHA